MRTYVLSALVTLLACAAGQSVGNDSTRQKSKFISMTEVSRGNRVSPDGQDHNVKIVLSEHFPFPTLTQWTLTVVRMINGDQDFYTVQAEDPYQTVVEFEADLTDAKYVYLVGRDSTQEFVNSYTELDPIFLSSRVARIGTKYDEIVSSLRVWPGDFNEVVVGENNCLTGNPCYYLSTSLPSEVPRCIPNYNKVNQCDDLITEFKELLEKPTLNITSDGMLTVQTILESKPTKMEAVVFDPQDPSRIFSPENFDCQLQINEKEMKCQQQLQDIGNVQELMVLLVSLNQEGFVLGSRLELYGDDSGPSSPRSPTGVIVGSVVGGVFGVALLSGAAIYFIRKKKSDGKKSSSNKTMSGMYDAVSSNDPS